jgi:hypothetical protein
LADQLRLLEFGGHYRDMVMYLVRLLMCEAPVIWATQQVTRGETMTSSPMPTAVEHTTRTVITLPAGFTAAQLAEAMEILDAPPTPASWTGVTPGWSATVVHSAPRPVEAAPRGRHWAEPA